MAGFHHEQPAIKSHPSGFRNLRQNGQSQDPLTLAVRTSDRPSFRRVRSDKRRRRRSGVPSGSAAVRTQPLIPVRVSPPQWRRPEGGPPQSAARLPNGLVLEFRLTDVGRTWSRWSSMRWRNRHPVSVIELTPAALAARRNRSARPKSPIGAIGNPIPLSFTGVPRFAYRRVP